MNWTDTALATVIVAAITAISGIIIALISRKGDPAKTEPTPIIVMRPENHATPPTQSAGDYVGTKSPEVKRSTHLSGASHDDISEHILRVPPFQRDSIEKHYIGLRVKWLVALHSVSEMSHNERMIYVETVPGKNTVECRAKPECIQCLIHLPQKGEFIIEGTIESVSPAFSILIDCEASLIQK